MANIYAAISLWNAHALAAKRRRRLGKLYGDTDLIEHVIARLQLGWSPEQISGRLRLDGDPRRLSHETIYAFIYGSMGQAARLWELLASHRRKRGIRSARSPRGVHIPQRNNIEQRPAEIGRRTSFGHWECDLVMFRREHGKQRHVSD
jgi:IS30 family transposase